MLEVKILEYTGPLLEYLRKEVNLKNDTVYTFSFNFKFEGKNDIYINTLHVGDVEK